MDKLRHRLVYHAPTSLVFMQVRHCVEYECIIADTFPI